VIIEVHGNVDRQAEEAGPQTGLEVGQQLWASLEHGSQEVAVAGLILAPVFKVLEEWVELAVWVALQVTVDGDVTPVPNLFREVCGVNDELWLEEGVLAVFGEETEIQGKVEVTEGLVNEASMAGLVTRQEGEDLCDHWVAVLQTTA